MNLCSDMLASIGTRVSPFPSSPQGEGWRPMGETDALHCCLCCLSATPTTRRTNVVAAPTVVLGLSHCESEAGGNTLEQENAVCLLFR